MMKVLIVDDDPGTLNALSFGLSSMGHEVVTAKDGHEALDILDFSNNEERLVELLITDMRMPGMDGLELIHSARKLRPDIPAILMTAYGNPLLQREVGKLVGCKYVEKPFDPETLLEATREIMTIS